MRHLAARCLTACLKSNRKLQRTHAVGQLQQPQRDTHALIAAGLVAHGCWRQAQDGCLSRLALRDKK